MQCSRFAVQTTAPCWWELDDDEMSVPLGGRQGWKQAFKAARMLGLYWTLLGAPAPRGLQLWAEWCWLTEDSPAVPQAAKWGCAISILRGFPDPTGSSPEQHGLTPELTSFEQEVGQGPPEVPSSLNGCVMLQICYLANLTGDGQNLKPSHWKDWEKVCFLLLMGWLLQKSCKLLHNLQQRSPVQAAAPSCP